MVEVDCHVVDNVLYALAYVKPSCGFFDEAECRLRRLAGCEIIAQGLKVIYTVGSFDAHLQQVQILHR